jgi:PAS domain S-box-containing protein
MKDIIRQLHEGLSAQTAKERFEKEVGEISSTEIADIEQSLINEGLAPEEIKKFCNVHALLFQSALEKAAVKETSSSHPVYLFKLENCEIEKLLDAIKSLMAKKAFYDAQTLKKELYNLLAQLGGVEIHYERKEQLLFPYLEKQGFMGPSKVMWGKDNEIREMLRAVNDRLETVKQEADWEVYQSQALNPLIEEVSGMIFKEENILFPTSMEKLSASDWVDILKESDQIGYVFIQKAAETESLIKELRAALEEEPVVREDAISLPTGTLSLKELIPLLNTLPVDLTFVDAEDKVRYFSEGKERIFHRTRSVIGRMVQNCHPPQSVDVVEKILTSFKEGKRDYTDFWLNYRGRYVYIRYLAVRNKEGEYLGTLEVSEDVTKIKKLEGEKRLLDERD